MANKAQKYLLKKECGDLILNGNRVSGKNKRIYASDIMMMFLESERGKKETNEESNCNITQGVPCYSEQDMIDFANSFNWDGDCNKDDVEWFNERKLRNL